MLWLLIYCDLLTWWRHQMETFSALLVICVGKFTGHRWVSCTNASDAEALMFSLICAWINVWVNNRETGSLGRHRAHYDVTVMMPTYMFVINGPCNIHSVQNRFIVSIPVQYIQYWTVKHTIFYILSTIQKISNSIWIFDIWHFHFHLLHL